MNESIGGTHRPAGVFIALLTGTLALTGLFTVLVLVTSQIELLSAVCALGVWAVIVAFIRFHVHKHNHHVFGLANQITLTRVLVAASLAGLIPAAASLNAPAWLWAIAITATLSLCLDGLDGYIARQTGLSSVFGARFDMETDALLALIIALFLWQSGKLGLWIISLGVMRYLFVIASIWLTPLRAELFPSMRRKVVCVLQIAALCLMLCPWVSAQQSTVVGIVALGALTYSFGVDVRWLLSQQRKTQSHSAMG